MASEHTQTVTATDGFSLRGALLPAIGLACTVLTPEINHLPSSSPVASGSSSTHLSFLAALGILLVAIVLMYVREKQAQEGERPKTESKTMLALYGVAALASSASSFVELSPVLDGGLIHVVLSACGMISVVVFLVCWFEYLLPGGVKQAAVTAALAGLITGSIELFLLGLQSFAVIVFLGFVPLISTACYAVVILGNRRLSSDAWVHQSFIALRFSEANWPSAVAFLVMVGCYAMVFGYIHRQWVPLQDGGTTSFLIQSGAALGTILAGIAVLVLVYRFWSPLSIMVLSGTLTALVGIALWLSSYVDPAWVFAYLVALNIAHKGVYLLIALAPFFPNTPPKSGYRWLVCYTAFEVGIFLSNIVHPEPGANRYVFVCLCIMVVVFICQAIITFKGMGATPEMEMVVVSVGAQDRRDTAATRTHKMKDACDYLSATHNLTNREQEILVYLARGRTASYIAEHLFIAPSTAKTHIRHVYDKLDVHTQQELISCVQHTIDDQRKA